jgi:hypothetical protein
VARLLPAHAPGHRFYEDIRKTNAALERLSLIQDSRVRVLDLRQGFTHTDGTLKEDLFRGDRIPLSAAGYSVYAQKLRPLLPLSQVPVSGLQEDL